MQTRPENLIVRWRNSAEIIGQRKTWLIAMSATIMLGLALIMGAGTTLFIFMALKTFDSENLRHVFMVFGWPAAFLAEVYLLSRTIGSFIDRQYPRARRFAAIGIFAVPVFLGLLVALVR